MVPESRDRRRAWERPPPRTWIQDAMQPGASAVPAAVTGTNPILLNQNADELFSQKRYGEAIPLYRRVIELDPEDLDAYNNLGLALALQGSVRGGIGRGCWGCARASSPTRPLSALAPPCSGRPA